MAHMPLNYSTDGGDKLHIGGTLEVGDGATVTGLADISAIPTAAADTLGCVKVGGGLSIADGVLSVDMCTPAANQAASTADTVVKLKNDFNTLLAALKAAGLMEADSDSEGGK